MSQNANKNNLKSLQFYSHIVGQWCIEVKLWSGWKLAGHVRSDSYGQWFRMDVIVRKGENFLAYYVAPV